MQTNLMTRLKGDHGSALVEAAIITPLVLLIMVGIFEVGRAYQTWQVVTNAAREGARAAIVPNANPTTVRDLVKKYMTDGQLSGVAGATVNVNPAANFVVNGTTFGATQVTVDYPYQFTMLNPVAKLINKNSANGKPLTMRATSLMRNEAQ
jgi:Flp pilus assembly protein TadG